MNAFTLPYNFREWLQHHLKSFLFEIFSTGTCKVKVTHNIEHERSKLGRNVLNVEGTP